MTSAQIRSIVLASLAVSLAAASTGCSSMSDIIRAKEAGEGTTRVQRTECDTAYRLALEAFRTEGAQTFEEHRPERYVLTSIGNDGMGAWFAPESRGDCAVTVVVRKVEEKPSTKLTEAGFHERLAAAVARLPGKTPVQPASTATPAPAAGDAAAKPAATATKPAKKAPPKKKAAKKPVKKAPAKTPAEAPSGAPDGQKDAGAQK